MPAVMRVMRSGAGGARSQTYIQQGGQQGGQRVIQTSNFVTAEELLRCKACQTLYSSDAEGTRLPRELDCHHVFCQACLESCCGRNSIVCPQCKRKTTLSGNKVMGLPVNRQLLGLLNTTGLSGSDEEIVVTKSSSHGSRKSTSGVTSFGDVTHRSEKQQLSQQQLSDVQQQLSKQQLSDNGNKIVYIRVPGSSQLIKAELVTEDDEVTAYLPSSSHQGGGGGAKGEKLKGEGGSRSSASFAKVTGSGSSQPKVAKSALKKTKTQTVAGTTKSSSSSSSGKHSAHKEGEKGAVGGDEGTVEAVVHYPIEELHAIGGVPDGEDVITAHQVSGLGDSYDWSLLADLPQQQPTTATYLASFGKYSEVRTQPGGFCRPTKIACSVEHKVVIVDTLNMTVQAFSPTGKCLAIFSVADVTGACFLSESLLAISSGRGVELFGIDGVLTKTISLGASTAICRYKEGFAAAHPSRLSLVPSYSGAALRRHTVSGYRRDPAASSTHFENVSDLAAGIGGELCVLDGNKLYRIHDEGRSLQRLKMPKRVVVVSAEGALLATINASVPSDLFQPYALSVDPVAGHLVVSDSRNRHVSMFAVHDGSLVRCVVNLQDQVENAQIRAYGVAVNGARQLFMVLRAPGLAETAIYRM